MWSFVTKGWFELLVFWTWMKQGQICSQISLVPGLKSFYCLRDWETCQWCVLYLQIENPAVDLSSWVRSSRALCSLWSCAILSFILAWSRRMLRIDMFPSWVSAKPSLGDTDAGSTGYCKLLCLHCKTVLSQTAFGSTRGPLGECSSFSAYWQNAFEHLMSCQIVWCKWIHEAESNIVYNYSKK